MYLQGKYHNLSKIFAIVSTKEERYFKLGKRNIRLFKNISLKETMLTLSIRHNNCILISGIDLEVSSLTNFHSATR